MRIYKIKKITIWLIVLTLLSASCIKQNRKPANDGLAELEWFLGNWACQTNEGIFTESWIKVNDTLYSGKSYFIKGSDTLSQETISLLQHDTSIFYVPVVEGQNDNKPVYFRLTYLDSVNSVFENPDHDFPQKIAYQIKKNDSLIAVISGTENGNFNSICFPMIRQKDAASEKNIK